MRRPSPAPNGLVVSGCLVFVAVLFSAGVPAHAQVTVGPNVNMAGGAASFTPPSTIIGDPFLQRQNEPSIAVSSRNPCHLLAGANDYRMVDVEEAAGEIGDAWLGVFKSVDCGATWTSTLLPGHKLDTSAGGLNAPIKGLAAAADPTVRAGTSGLFYYSGLAFNRGDGEVAKVFVARFIDNNNKDGGDPIQYAGMAQIDVGTSGQFLDKPWIVADIPRGDITCTVNGRSVPAGPVYLVYTSFLGNGDNDSRNSTYNVHSAIMFSKSTDCGATWSNPSKLSERVSKNQGTTIAVDPGTGDVHVAWREFASPGDATSRNAILYVRSTDGGKSFTKAAAIQPNGYALTPFDQASSFWTFRTNAYPSLAVVPAEADGRAAGAPGRVYVAWSARGFAADARIVMSSAMGGTGWTSPRLADAYAGSGHQIMPALAFAGGKVALAYYDLRDDRAGGFEQLVFEFGLSAFESCGATLGSGATFSQLMTCILAHPNGLSRRHTLDMRAAMVDSSCLGLGTCSLESTSVLGASDKVSKYREGRGAANGPKIQLQYNRPNLPIFSKGRFPFIGDYIDIAGQSFVSNADGSWAWNTGQTANRPAPVFHVTWADNRNVGTPRDSNWANFTPAVLGPAAVQCVPGQVGIRNQDVYTAQLRPGLIVAAPQNSKRIAGLQRSFVVVARNTTDVEHTYVLTAAPPAGVIASFDQFAGFGTGEPVTQIAVTIPRRSSISRTLFVSLENPPADPNSAPDVLVPVNVEQVPDTSGDTGFDVVFLNPDFENPDFENPDFENTELHNPDFENPDFENPDFENPDFENFTLSASSSIRNPDFENPDFENPDFENPDFENPDFENPDFENPDFENPDFENPDFENPDFENPDFENPDFENGSFEVSDTTWPVRNDGNTTSAYKANLFVNNPPAGVRYQLAVRKIFTSPAAICAADNTPAQTAASVPLVNIVGPNVSADPFDRNFNDPGRDNATFSLAPGERGIITLRAYCAQGDAECTRGLMASLQGQVALGVVAQGANCRVCTGDSCTIGDFIRGGTECVVDDGPPRDIYDPIAPRIAVLDPDITVPESTFLADDLDNSGGEVVGFSVSVTDNVAVGSVTCVSSGAAILPAGGSGSTYAFSGNFPVGTFGVTCAARDVRVPAPNTASVNFLVTVKDVTPPSFEASGAPGSPFVPSNPAEATSPAGAVVGYTTPGASDSNGGPVIVTCRSSGGLTSGSTFPVGVTPINCVATDQSGVSTPPTALFNITVADTTAPAIQVAGPAAVTIEAGTAYVDQGASAYDIVAGNVVVSSSHNILPLVVGTYQVIYTATDGRGNTSTATRTVVVVDTTPPAITINLAPVSVEGNTLGGAVVSFSATGSDVVSGTLSATCAPASGSVFAVGTTPVTCSATDGSGNVGTASASITVVDTTPPVVSLAGLSTLTLEAGAAFADPGASASDIVAGAVAVSAIGSVNTMLPGSYTLTYSATDAHGNTASRTRTVIVVDTTAPALGPSAGFVVEATSASGAVATYSAPTATDVVGATVTCAPASGSTFALGGNTVSCTATDPSGNSSSSSFTISVVDTTPPVVALAGLPAAAVQGHTLGGASVAFTASATDLVSGAVTTSCSPASGSVFPVGVTTITCTATDAAGNTGSSSASVTVIDTIPPVVTRNGASPVTVEAGTVYTDAGATAADAVSGPRPVTTTGTVNTSALGTYTLTYSATDAAGNTGTTTRTVTVVDTIAPVVTATPSPATLLWSPNKTMTPVTVSGVVTDATTVSVTYKVVDEYGKIQPAGSVTVGAGGAYKFVVSLEAYRNGNDSNGRLYTITVTAVDAAGRASSATTTVLVPHNQ